MDPHPNPQPLPPDGRNAHAPRSISSPSKDSIQDDKMYQSFKQSLMAPTSPQKRAAQQNQKLMGNPGQMNPPPAKVPIRSSRPPGYYEDNPFGQGSFESNQPSQFSRNPPPYMFSSGNPVPLGQPTPNFFADDFLINDPSPIPLAYQRPRRNVNYDKFDLGLMFDSSNYEEEEDEDYSLKEDLRQNPNAYKEEDEFNLRKKFVVPKSEVDDLIQDLRNPLPMVTASMDPKSAHQAQLHTSLNISRRKMNESAIIPSQTMQIGGPKRGMPAKPGLLHNQTPFGSMHNHANSSSNDLLGKYNQSALTNQMIDSMFTGNNSRIDDFQRGYSQPQGGASMQNNYYYNFNNNFLGGGQHAPSQDQSQGHNHGKQVKSIEIQVTPEKLQDVGEGGHEGLGSAGGVGTGNQDQEHLKNGKRRRRRRKNESDVRTESVSSIPPKQSWPGYPQQPQVPYYGAYPQYYGQPGSTPQQYNAYYPQQPGYPQAYPYYPHQTPQYQVPTKLLPGGHTYPPPPSPGMQYYQPPPPPQPNQMYPSPTMPHFEEPYKDMMGPPIPASLRDFSRSMLYQFTNEQLRQLVQQIEVYIQMLYQFLLYPSRKSSLEEAEDAIVNKGQPGNPVVQAVKPEKKQPGLASVASKDPTKYRAYCLLYEFISKKDGILKTLNLPTYRVPLDSIRPLPQQTGKKKVLSTQDEPVVLRLSPQVSFFHSPLLEIAPDVIKQMTKANSVYHNDREIIKQTTKFFKRYQPLVNPFLLPINRSIIPANKSKSKHGRFSYFKRSQLPMKRAKLSDGENEELKQDGNATPADEAQDDEEDFDDIDKVQHIHQLANSINNNRRKFTLVDDNFLLLGLRQHGYKQVANIMYDWLPRKTECEIKHRYKNLTCAKAADNLIKRWKNTHSTPLSEYELHQLARAVRWFQPGTTRRWGLIARCFFPNRSPKFLSDEYQAILHDQKKAEKFGRLMLKDGSSKNPQANPEAADEDDDNFEEVDLDEVVSPKNTHQPNLTEYDRTDDELYEEHSLGGASSESEVNKRSQKSLAKQAERLMKLELYAPGDSGAEEEVIQLE